MALYALEDLDDALAATRAFLTPVDRTTWLKLAVVVLFVAGPGANLNALQFDAGAGDPDLDLIPEQRTAVRA